MKTIIIAPILAVLLVGCSKTETTTSQTSEGTDRYGSNRHSSITGPAIVATNESQISREIARNKPVVPPEQKEQLSRPIEEKTQRPVEGDLGQQVQAALMADDSLKAAAGNVQATASDDGTVTLKGSVTAEKEKSDIEAKVKEMSGVKKVDNQIEIKSAEPEKKSEQNIQEKPIEPEKKYDQEKPEPDKKNS
jgi:osmotically-inducible protein OsmY